MWINEKENWIAFEVFFDGKHAYFEYINWNGNADIANQQPLYEAMMEINPGDFSDNFLVSKIN